MAAVIFTAQDVSVELERLAALALETQAGHDLHDLLLLVSLTVEVQVLASPQHLSVPAP
jgi:hypothetical protein